MKSLLTPLAKTVLIPLSLSSGMSAADAAIQKKIYGSSHPLNVASRTAALIISNAEIKDIMKIIRSLEEPRLLRKGISETNKNEAKEQETELLSMSLQILAVSILQNALAGKRII